jgi:hypothetical protein
MAVVELGQVLVLADPTWYDERLEFELKAPHVTEEGITPPAGVLVEQYTSLPLTCSQLPAEMDCEMEAFNVGFKAGETVAYRTTIHPGSIAASAHSTACSCARVDEGNALSARAGFRGGDKRTPTPERTLDGGGAGDQKSDASEFHHDHDRHTDLLV